MGHFSELDLKIRQFLPNYLDLPLPACLLCGKPTQITGFAPARTLVLTCTVCNRRVEHYVAPGISNSSNRIQGGMHGRHRSSSD